jgi:hypothetical protein
MKRAANLHLSSSHEHALRPFEQTLREQEDLAPASRRHALGDICHRMTSQEAHGAEHTADTQDAGGFVPRALPIPTLIRSRTSLHMVHKRSREPTGGLGCEGL